MFQATNFKNWLVDGAVVSYVLFRTFISWYPIHLQAGQVKSYKQLTFLQVEDAGHMVPYNVPKQVSLCISCMFHLWVCDHEHILYMQVYVCILVCICVYF